MVTTSLLASISTQLTDALARHGALAVFALMAADALLPVGGELIMLYAGVLAAGAAGGSSVALLGWHPATGLPTYLLLALAGTLGYLSGALVGWLLGARGGRALVERHGRRLHLGPDNLRRAEAWFARYGNRAVLIGRITPVVRSFISVPAGMLGSALAPYTALTLVGSAIWCFAFAGAGWAAGDTWATIHHDFRYADIAVGVAVTATAFLLGSGWVRRRRSASA